MAVDIFFCTDQLKFEREKTIENSFRLFCCFWVDTVMSQRQDSHYIVDSDALINACSSGTYTDEMQAPVPNTTVLRILQFVCYKRKSRAAGLQPATCDCRSFQAQPSPM